MKIGTPKEIFDGENRVALTPDSALQLQKLGFDCLIESGAGKAAGYSDKIYKEAGVKVVKTAAALWKEADVVTKVRQPSTAELKRLSAGQTLISFFNPARAVLHEVPRYRRDLAVHHLLDGGLGMGGQLQSTENGLPVPHVF